MQVRSKLAYLLGPSAGASVQVGPGSAAEPLLAGAADNESGGPLLASTEAEAVPAETTSTSADQSSAAGTSDDVLDVISSPREVDSPRVQQLESRVSELTAQLEEAENMAELWRAHVSDLETLLRKHADIEIPELPVARGTLGHVRPMRLEQRRSVPSEGRGILGIESRACDSCRKSEEAAVDRVFVETGKLYCNSCWSAWERCGWWKPSIRVSTVPPPVRVPGGLPQYVAEDAFFLPGFLCPHDDLSLFEALRSELPVGRDFIDWHGARHLGMQFDAKDARHDSDDAPPMLRATVARLEAAFGMQAGASRLNLYRSRQDYKPFHCDRGRDNSGRPQMTVGASFGATRELTMVHIKSGVTASFPQRNGDVFSFTPELNATFMHGVPKIGYGSPSEAEGDGPRLSLILWGCKLADPAS